MDTLMQDVRYAVRMLVKSPAFTLVAVAALAIGIGANTAIFSVINAALLHPVPFAEPDRLMALNSTKPGTMGEFELSYPTYRDVQAQSKSFSTLAGYARTDGLLTAGTQTQRVDMGVVTGDFFPMLGVTPAVGRTFQAGEENSTAQSVVLTYGGWQRMFHSDPSVVGRTVAIDGEARTIVGVVQREFQFAPLGSAEVFMLVSSAPKSFLERRNLYWLLPLGRLKPGVTEEQARAEMDTLAAQFGKSYPEAQGGIDLKVTPLTRKVVGDVRPILLVLMAAVGFVLLIACVNVANLLLTRAVARQREIAIRNALGAGRGRIIRQLLTESLVLSLAGGAAGIVFGSWALEVLIRAIPAEVLKQMPYLQTASLGAAPLAFTAGVSILAGMLFGMAPAWQASAQRSYDTLKESSGWGSSRNRVGFVLVSMEVALSVILLAGAGLMIKSLVRMFDADPGFNTQNLLTAQVFLPAAKYDKDEPNVQVERRIREELKTLPGVVDVGSATRLVLSGGGGTARVQAEGKPLVTGGEAPEGEARGVSPNYFQVLGATLLKGRYFNDGDTLTSPQVVIVNRSMANLAFGTTDVVGKRLRFTFRPQEKYREIVGVVDDVKESSLDGTDKPATYLPYPQDTSISIGYVMRTHGEPGGLKPTVVAAINKVEPSAAVFQVRSMQETIDESYPTFLRRYPAMLISSFGGVALLLALIGLYGIISYAVSQRTREIGIRMALGAQRGDVLRMFVREGARITLGGLVVGVPAALVAGQLVSGLLFGIKPHDAQVMLLAPMCLAVMSVLAVLVPAYRATRVEPTVALRYE